MNKMPCINDEIYFDHQGHLFSSDTLLSDLDDFDIDISLLQDEFAGDADCII